ncbi:MAG: tRNA (adenosine(37)-N6)-threonylcarbamoyltransferase complex dimerization subunit type 1 TsaB [Flavobacteriales bacterium]|nr:MAG: tRNA (adenosine(37)-N6)-threonylcarbamoyltransferase complex dimerization subunit type 1 TsaB [Flavobacteriales bacterium]
MIILIESSAEFPSIGLISLDGRSLYHEEGSGFHSHAEMLPEMVQRAVAFARESLVDGGRLLAVALNEGPGSYTGLRIGSSMAKGLCYGLKIPFIAVSGFESLAMAALAKKPQCEDVWVLMDARRDEVYACNVHHKNGVVNPIQSLVLPHDLLRLANQNTCFVGNANEKLRRLMDVHESQFWDQSPRAEQLGDIAVKKYHLKQFADIAYFEPLYLKDFVAGLSKKISL